VIVGQTILAAGRDLCGRFCGRGRLSDCGIRFVLHARVLGPKAGPMYGAARAKGSPPVNKVHWKEKELSAQTGVWPGGGLVSQLPFIRHIAYCASMADMRIPRIHSDTVFWLARAAASIRFRSGALKRTGTIRPLASPLGSLGRPTFGLVDLGTVFMLL
jgi:hypothetical protein